jgi:hypothetical protein
MQKARLSRRSYPRHRVLRLAKHWNVVRFLSCGASVLVVLGISGITGLLASLSSADLFNPPGWIHWVHLLFGLFVLAVAMAGTRSIQLGLALFGAVAGIALGCGGLIFSLFASGGIGGSRADLSDPLAHLAVGVSAACALINRRRYLNEQPGYSSSDS